MIAIDRLPNRSRAIMTAHVAPVLLVAAWGAYWIAAHGSGRGGHAHTLFQTAALAESVVALLLRRRKPVGALVGIVVAYFLFQLDAILLPALLLALLNLALLRERRTVLPAATASAAAVALVPFAGRASVGLAGYLLPRLLAIAAAAAIGLFAQRRIAKGTR